MPSNLVFGDYQCYQLKSSFSAKNPSLMHDPWCVLLGPPYDQQYGRNFYHNILYSCLGFLDHQPRSCNFYVSSLLKVLSEAVPKRNRDYCMKWTHQAWCFHSFSSIALEASIAPFFHNFFLPYFLCIAFIFSSIALEELLTLDMSTWNTETPLLGSSTHTMEWIIRSIMFRSSIGKCIGNKVR